MLIFQPLCNFDQCNGTHACTFTIRPFDGPNLPVCAQTFGDSYRDDGCQKEEFLFDGFDDTRRYLRDCSPYFDTICTANFSDGICNEHCNNTDCLFDGWDCVNKSKPGAILPVPLSGIVIVELKSAPELRVKKVLELLLNLILVIQHVVRLVLILVTIKL